MVTKNKEDVGDKLSREVIDWANKQIDHKGFDDILDAIKFDMVDCDHDYLDLVKKAVKISSNSSIGERFCVAAEKLDFSPEELLSLLESNIYGLELRRARDHKLSIEARGPSGRRLKRSSDDLPDPSSTPQSEANRMDKRLVAQIPKVLAYRFKDAVDERQVSSLKEAFEKGYDRWLASGCPKLAVDHVSYTGAPVSFQVRVDPDIPGSLSDAVASSGMTKKDAIAQILIEYIDNTF